MIPSRLLSVLVTLAFVSGLSATYNSYCDYDRLCEFSSELECVFNLCQCKKGYFHDIFSDSGCTKKECETSYGCTILHGINSQCVEYVCKCDSYYHLDSISDQCVKDHENPHDISGTAYLVGKILGLVITFSILSCCCCCIKYRMRRNMIKSTIIIRRPPVQPSAPNQTFNINAYPQPQPQLQPQPYYTQSNLDDSPPRYSECANPNPNPTSHGQPMYPNVNADNNARTKY